MYCTCYLKIVIELFITFTISENTGAKICGMIQPRR